MAETINLRDTLFLRMSELLQGYSPFMWDDNQYLQFLAGWEEIEDQVLREADMIRSEEKE